MLKEVIKNMRPYASTENTANRFCQLIAVTKQLMAIFSPDCKQVRRAGHRVKKRAIEVLEEV